MQIHFYNNILQRLTFILHRYLALQSTFNKGWDLFEKKAAIDKEKMAARRVQAAIYFHINSIRSTMCLLFLLNAYVTDVPSALE